MGEAGKSARQPFAEHISELRKRVMWCLLVLVLGSALGYAINGQLLHLIRAPLKSQLYYTSPIGGFNAILSISILFGIALSVPLIVYNVIRFIIPALNNYPSYRNIPAFRLLIASTLLAIGGICFGYYVSLPASLHFLTNVGNNSLQPFITISEYLQFTLSYLVGFAILFQLPLILFFINRIRPLKPGGMMRFQRYIVLFSFILAAILTPTPDPINQVIMAAPVVVLYQFSVAWIWLINKSRKAPKLDKSTATRPSPVPQVAITAPKMHHRGLTMDIFRAPATVSNNLSLVNSQIPSPVKKPAGSTAIRQRYQSDKLSAGSLIMDIMPA